jgi:tRNA wybutosine-synthesizing protein 1
MVDEPGEIVRAAIEARRLLLSGFGGHPEVNKDKFVEALTPTMMTMSLVGEPTLYPRLGELIGEARRAHMRCFLVTNGTTAQALAELDPLPWQLYVTLPAPDEATYRRVCRPLIPDGWQRIEETLELLPSLGCRRVIRLTLVRGLNLKAPTTYARLIERADPDFCEVKAFTWVGEARRRLRQANVPSMEEVYQFAHELAKMTGFTLADKHIPSRVVLLINR